MDDTRGKHWKDVDEEGYDRKNIHALRQEVYVKDKQELIKREFLVSVSHPKEGNIVWTRVKDNILEGKKYCKSIGLSVFDYKLFQ